LGRGEKGNGRGKAFLLNPVSVKLRKVGGKKSFFPGSVYDGEKAK